MMISAFSALAILRLLFLFPELVGQRLDYWASVLQKNPRHSQLVFYFFGTTGLIVVALDINVHSVSS